MTSGVVSCFHAGFTAHCDGRGRGGQVFELSAVYHSPKDTARAFRYIALTCLLLPRCSPIGVLLAHAGAMSPPLAAVGIQPMDQLWRPGRRHSQRGCRDSLYAACGGSPAPGSDLESAGASTSKSAENGQPRGVPWPRRAGRRRASAGRGEQARCGCMLDSGPHAQEPERAASRGSGSSLVRPRSCQERLSAQPPTGLQWAPSPQVVDSRRAEGQGELVAWLCQQDAAGRTSSGPPGIELCNCSILNNYEPIRGKCQLKVCEWRSE